MLIKSVEAKGEEMRITEMTSKQAPHFVLIHGISGGAWCWYKLRCLMENSGYKVTCIELTSGGIDRSDASSVLSFDDYSKPLTDFLSALPENQKVVSTLYSLSLCVTSCMICLIEAMESILSGDSGRPQCRRAERDSGE